MRAHKGTLIGGLPTRPPSKVVSCGAAAPWFKFATYLGRYEYLPTYHRWISGVLSREILAVAAFLITGQSCQVAGRLE